MVLKFVIVGDKSVGKFTLRNRFLGFGTGSYYLMTIGVEYGIKEIVHQEEPFAGSNTYAQVWLITSQERFASIRPLYYQNSQMALLVYDVTVPQSLENIVNWIKEIQASVGIIPVVLIGNKIDLRKNVPNSVTTAIGSEFAKRIKRELLNDAFEVPFVETSAITGEVIPTDGILVTIKGEVVTSFYLFDS